MDLSTPKVVNDSSVTWIESVIDREKPHCKNKVALVEIPFDYAVSHRPGTRFGPKSILRELYSYSLYCTDKNVCLDNLQIFHRGEVSVVHSLEQSYRHIYEHIKNLPKDEIPIVLGGDHSITDPIMRAMIEHHSNNFGLIVFDAHFDSREPVAGKEHSGHWMKTISDVYNYSHTVQLGINAPIYSQQYLNDAYRANILVLTPYQIRKIGISTMLEKLRQHMDGVKKCYISVDIDCLDQAFAPGTSVPNAGGLYPYEVMDSVYEIAKEFSIIGFDLTEVSPPLDLNNMTSAVAANIVMNFMAGLSQNGALKSN